ncbi:hemerythrin domain-containing protein [Clostridium sp. DL1XJH146]
MLANNYPKYNQQKASHDKFTKDVQDAIIKYREQGANLIVLLGFL